MFVLLDVSNAIHYLGLRVCACAQTNQIIKLFCMYKIELEDVNYNIFPKRDMYVGLMNDYEVILFVL